MFTRQLPQKKKSCQCCVKAKRKCDLALPKCSRCTKQNLECVYPYAETGTMQESGIAEIPFHLHAVQPGNKLDISFEPMAALDFSTVHSNTLMVDEILAEMPSFDSLVDIPGTDIIAGLPDQEIALVGTHEPPFNASRMGRWYASRLLFAVDLIKRVPRTMVEENCTPWSHSRLYDDAMPDCLSEAYAACALSLSRTTANSSYVARHVARSFDKLLASPVPSTLSSLLAHVHAFILYLSIQVFSNDYHAHAQANRALFQLESYGLQLHTLLIMDSGLDVSILPESLTVFPINAASHAWRQYILHESARRTMLFIFFMQSLCSALKGYLGSCREDEALSCYLLGSVHLWKADSAFDFAKAWNDRDRLVVRDVDFGPVLNDSHPQDLDCFSLMLLIAKCGIDEVRGWFDYKGAKFEQITE